MKPFLHELAEKIIGRSAGIEDYTFIFPNRRAALFFRNYLGKEVKSPVWSPRLITIEELFRTLSSIQEADRLGLIFRLYHVYRDLINKDESFDRFYFWGDMLMRDFDELDKYVAPAERLFRDLSNWRELDETLEALTEEQLKFLKDFWVNFGDRPMTSKEEFLRVWRQLPRVYARFTQALRKEGVGYEGMIQRDVAEKILEKGRSDHPSFDASKMIFAGFNALTKAEEILIGHYAGKGAQIYWDLDAFYVDDKNQEAGQFFRQYKKHPALRGSFGDSASSNFIANDKNVDLYGVPQKVGQAKLLGQLLEKLKISGDDEEISTVIVLPDESLLMAVLHSLPPEIGSINVTMGYPLKNTPVYNLMELLLELQIHRKDNLFSHRQTTAILAHPYVLAKDEAVANGIRLEIIEKNRIHIPATELQAAAPLLKLLFRPVEPQEITAYFLEIIRWLGTTFNDDQGFDREYAYHFHNMLARFSDVLKDSGSNLELKGFQKLFRQVVQSEKIPFSGEPLKGLQIMGVLETRNLDFDNVFILSLNEGLLPAAARQGSYVPHAIRKAYSLPTHDHQDAMYAYLFYRLLQRAKNIRLLYNTEPDILGTGEMSRFVQQLLYESGWKINHHILSNPIELHAVTPIVIAKTEGVITSLRRFANPEGSGISPSALNEYIECSLRFYLKYVAGIREADEVEENLDARVFGIFLHNVMDWFYHDLMERTGSVVVKPEYLDPSITNDYLVGLIDRAFHEHYDIDPKRKIEYVGQRIVVREIVLQFAQRIIEVDRAYAPFAIELLEEKKFTSSVQIDVNGKEEKIFIGGRIDRVDSKDSVSRVIDYKTGKDELSFESIESLFSRQGIRNKSAFQTILYAWLYDMNFKPPGPVRPLIINRKNLYDDDLKYFTVSRAKVKLLDVRPDLPKFEDLLTTLLTEMFNKDIPFVQTTEEKNCKYCVFKNMCRR